MKVSVMKVSDGLHGILYLFLDTAPVITYVEGNPDHFAVAKAIFTLIDNG